ncbi:hypothetical protein LUZ60_005334 [Juncus effusus]|nr:hypothetical protein LUZ60_005334 [Juncus effusus]
MASGKRVVVVERDSLASRLMCPLCEHIFEEATTIILCLHTFCRKCITEKLQEEENCPVCDLHLGATPTEKIRPDHSIQSLREKLFPPKITESDRGDKSESVPHAEPAVETERAESVSSAEVNDSPQKPAQSRHHRKKGGKKKGSAHHGPGPVINKPVVEKDGQVKEEIEQAPLEVESSRQSLEERESSDKSELMKPLNSLALEPETGTDRDAKGKGVEMPPPDSKGKGKRKGKKERNGAGSSGTTGTATGTGTGQPERKFTNVWNRALILPQISPNIIRIKDGNMTVSSVQKYLTQKLGLSNESEVRN